MSTAIASKKQEVKIELPQLNIKHIQLKVVGDSPLIEHKWSEKAKKEMLDKQMGVAKQAKQKKDPWRDFIESIYFLDKTPDFKKVKASDLKKYKYGFPAVGFKSAAVDACSHIEGVTKVEARGSFHIVGDLIEIHGTPDIREDMVRIGMGTADIRYRGEFKEWSAVLPIRYNANMLTPEQIANLFNTAGFAIGIGEWRPQKNGSNGMFHVV